MARNDYTNGGYKMLSCSDPRAAADVAVRHALAMSAMLFALPFALQHGAALPDVSHTCGTAAMCGAGGAGLLWARVAFTRDITMEWAKKTFLFSLLVVPIIMAAGAVWWLVTSPPRPPRDISFLLTPRLRKRSSTCTTWRLPAPTSLSTLRRLSLRQPWSRNEISCRVKRFV
jgi:hypothetical protein